MQGKSLLSIILIACITGCATVSKETKDTQVQQLKMEIGKLKEELQQKNEEIDFLEQQLQKSQSQKVTSTKERKPKGLGGATTKITTRNVQIALKNAGFYHGPLDGVMGKKAKKAVKDFQKANNLTVDGVVGKETWFRLMRYL